MDGWNLSLQPTKICLRFLYFGGRGVVVSTKSLHNHKTPEINLNSKDFIRVDLYKHSFLEKPLPCQRLGHHMEIHPGLFFFCGKQNMNINIFAVYFDHF